LPSSDNGTTYNILIEKFMTYSVEMGSVVKVYFIPIFIKNGFIIRKLIGERGYTDSMAIA
jgi:hypothetical protein